MTKVAVRTQAQKNGTSQVIQTGPMERREAITPSVADKEEGEEGEVEEGAEEGEVEEEEVEEGEVEEEVEVEEVVGGAAQTSEVLPIIKV